MYQSSSVNETSPVTPNYGMTISGEAVLTSGVGTEVKVKVSGISPKLYFKYVKKKFGFLGGIKYERRIKKLEKLALEAEKDGQVALSEKFLSRLLKEIRESEMYAYGYKIFIESEHLQKFKYKVKGNCICETPLKNYVKIIPEDVKKKINEAIQRKVFDEIVIVHYDPNGRAIEKTEKEEREDPIVFGKIEQGNRYYFIDDWEDEDCDLTIEDIVDKLALVDKDITLNKNPKL